MKRRNSVPTLVPAFLLLGAVGAAGACGSTDNSTPYIPPLGPVASGMPTGSAPPSMPPTPTPTGTTPTPPSPTGPSGGITPPAPPSTPPAVAQYHRGSLTPQYELLPQSSYGNFNTIGGVQDTDFESQNVTESASAKMSEVAAQIAQDNGSMVPPTIIAFGDQSRAGLIPFRGEPTDVKFLNLNGQTKLYAVLGGSIMTPGNEIAVVSSQNNKFDLTTRVVVGIRPQRIAIHPDNLVFVCNQYSNYISVIDPRTDTIFQSGNKPVEIPTQYYCSDLAFVPTNPAAPNPDDQFLFVANRWRHSVIKYHLLVTRDASNEPSGITILDPPNGDPTQAYVGIETTGVGPNPLRLSLSQQQDSVYVVNGKGGGVARVQIGLPGQPDVVNGYANINGPSMDIVNINDLLYVPTTTVDRGLLSKDQPLPSQVLANPVIVQGLDNQPHVAHPGAMFDNTRSYNFEDLRNGLMQLDFQLGSNLSFVFFTDDNSSEPNFQAQQKVLSGSLPTAVVRSADGSKIFLAHGGSDVVQELLVNTAAQPFTLTEQQGLTFATQHRPYALSLNEQANQLYVADFGSDIVEVFDTSSGKSIAQIDLGYAQPTYPATPVEQGEFFFYNTPWSNNGRKACATCHIDELDTDGVGFSNGATAPTEYHQVKPNHNLADTPAYFWNGSFGNGNYTSLAFAAQTKDNCELVEFGLIEGPGSDPTTRVGDPNNFTANPQLDVQCRPIDGNVPGEVQNAAQIAQIVKQEAAVEDARILQITGQTSRQALARLVDVYSVANNRLPPNPQRFLFENNQLAQAGIDAINKGEQVFTAAGCVNCHSNTATDAYGQKIYTDQRNHGGGADWVQRFVSAYGDDPRITTVIGSIPQTMTQAAIVQSTPDHEINTHVVPIDFFVPFCFDVTNCLEFDDPLAVFTNNNSQNPEFTEESRRLTLLLNVNLADPDRQFVPGNVFVAPQMNTPSLRGMWTQANLLHHGLARSIREAVLAPGHPALKPGENGFAIDRFGNIDVHGVTSMLTADQVEQLVQYVQTIQ